MMLNISHCGSSNQNRNEIPLHGFKTAILEKCQEIPLGPEKDTIEEGLLVAYRGLN